MNEKNSSEGSRAVLYVTIISAIAAIGGLLFGYDTGVISGAILFIRDEFSLSMRQTERMVSIVLVGSTLGALVGGMLGDRAGRRRMIILAALIFGIASAACAVATSASTLLIFRFIIGVGIGIASFIAPLYIAEMAPAHIRGSMVFLNQLAVTAGILVSYLVNFSYADNPGGWRWMLGIAVVPAAALGIGMWLMAESPRWLIATGKEETGRAVLKKIRDTENVEEEVKETRKEIQGESSGRWSDLLRPELKRPLTIGIGLAAFQQLSGINTVIYYAPTIIQKAGITSQTGALVGTIGVGVVNVLFTILGIWLIDRTGRRKLLLSSLLAMAVGLCLLALGFQAPRLAQSLGKVTVAFLMIYVAAFAIGLGPIFWLLLSEIYPASVSSRAMSLATMVNWGTNWLIAATFLTLAKLLNTAGIFWLYAFLTVAALVFTYYFVPETKGKTLEQIQEDFKAEYDKKHTQRPRSRDRSVRSPAGVR